MSPPSRSTNDGKPLGSRLGGGKLSPRRDSPQRTMERSDVVQVRNRIEQLLNNIEQVGDSNQAGSRADIDQVRERVQGLLDNTIAVESRLRNQVGIQEPPRISSAYSAAPPPLPAPSALLNPGAEAMMQYRLGALRGGGQSQGQGFDASFWQKLEALEAEAQMIFRLEKLEAEQKELRHATGTTKGADLNVRIDILEQDVHGRIDKLEQNAREQRMALKVFDAGFRHRLEAMDAGLKQHRDILTRVTFIEQQVTDFKSFEDGFVRRLEEVQFQLEQWANNST